MFEDAQGFKRLAIDKKRKHVKAVANFHLLSDAYRALWKLVNEHELDAALCFLDKTAAPPDNLEKAIYNQRVDLAIAALKKELGTFAIVETSAYSRRQASCILIEKGKFYGMGIIAVNDSIDDIEKLKEQLTPYPENETIYSLIKSVIQKPATRIIEFQ